MSTIQNFYSYRLQNKLHSGSNKHSRRDAHSRHNWAWINISKTWVSALRVAWMLRRQLNLSNLFIQDTTADAIHRRIQVAVRNVRFTAEQLYTYSEKQRLLENSTSECVSFHLHLWSMFWGQTVRRLFDHIKEHHPSKPNEWLTKKR